MIRVIILVIVVVAVLMKMTYDSSTGCRTHGSGNTMSQAVEASSRNARDEWRAGRQQFIDDSCYIPLY